MATFTGTFTGTPNNGIISKSLSTDANRYTAIGNPYPSPISLEIFLMQTAIYFITVQGFTCGGNIIMQRHHLMLP
ncbi:hypothetical protein [Flavobacterium psychrotrophum]|uniref:hypothetical protein n=1 Tax=Flavobacterium psychrotrophum TaxID=2294119 RepID=UPI000E31399A|nr:hypothetical protein [Flavobacterium psychrotrophum]